MPKETTRADLARKIERAKVTAFDRAARRHGAEILETAPFIFEITITKTATRELIKKAVAGAPAETNSGGAVLTLIDHGAAAYDIRHETHATRRPGNIAVGSVCELSPDRYTIEIKETSLREVVDELTKQQSQHQALAVLTLLRGGAVSVELHESETNRDIVH